MSETRHDRLSDHVDTLRSSIEGAALDCDTIARQPVCSEGERRAWKSMANKLRGILDKYPKPKGAP